MKSLKMMMNSCLCCMFATAVFAQTQDQTDYNTWDTDQNNAIDPTEFNARHDNTHFDDWDANDDNVLDQTEWDDNANAYFEENDYGRKAQFSDWDANNDDFINKTEYSEGSFGMWDEDDSGLISVEEYECITVECGNI